MKRRFYRWLRQRFLPEWARRQLVEENARIYARLEETEQTVMRLEAYLQGMQEGLRWQRKIGAKGIEAQKNAQRGGERF